MVYGQYLDFPLLKSQVSVVYTSEQFHRNSVSDLFSDDIIDVIPKVSKLVCLIVMIPMKSASVERSFRIKAN